MFAMGGVSGGTPEAKGAGPVNAAIAPSPSQRLAGFDFPLKDYAAKHGKTWLPL
jgi:hypothetical protein